MSKLNATETRLAKAFAANLAECERRNDFGGLHAQAARDLTDTILTHVPYTGYVMPSGRVTKDRAKAFTAWVAAAK